MKRLVTTLLLALAACAAVPAGASAACAGADVEVEDVAAAERTMLCLVNEYRVANGRSVLVLDARLARAARAHAADMVARDYFSHDTPEGLSPSDRARREGFPSGAGENIAWATTVTPGSMFEQWRTSSGHNQNMLHTGYNVVGMGFALGNPSGGSFAGRGATGVQAFGRLASVPAGGDTGLGDAPSVPSVPVPPVAAPVATAPKPPVTVPACSARAQVARALARLRRSQARLRAARSRRARARARRQVAAARRDVARLRARAAVRC